VDSSPHPANIIAAASAIGSIRQIGVIFGRLLKSRNDRTRLG
jgi:hypothetical protein